MSGRVERVRAGLVVGCVLLLVGLAGTYGFARYRAGKAWLNKIKKNSGASLVRETDGFTYSQSLQGKTVFTLHAAKAFQYTDGHLTLHDVVITLYGLKEARKDRVYGSEFEWDENKGVARAVGEVHMDLQVPSGVTSTPRHGSPATAEGAADNIHVKTSGLVYLRNLGVAATQERIEFEYKGMTCTAIGAELNSDPNSLHLLSNVEMHGLLRGKPVSMHAVKADFDRGSNIAEFVSPVVTSQGRTARAANAVLHLRQDGSVATADATGNVAMDAETMHVTGERLDAVMTEKNQPQSAKLSGGVKLVDTSAKHPVQGEAGEMRLRFDGEGRPAEVTAVNKAHVTAREAAENGAWLDREMRGDQVVATFHAEGRAKPQLQQVHATGGAMLRGDSLTKAVAGKPASQKTTSVAGDDLLMNFIPGTGAKGVRLEKLHGQGHAVLRQTAALGEEHTSSGDVLDIAFADPAGKKDAQGQVSSAVLAGHVVIGSHAALKPGSKKPQDVSSGNAERASYDGGTERLSLTGGVHLVDGGTSMTADAVVMDQRSGDAEAHGNVAATLAGAQTTHIAAQQAVLHKASEVAEFTGNATRPARLWQDASQVEATTIVLDRAKQTLVAHPGVASGTVRSVFASTPKTAAAVKESAGLKAGTGPSILRVESRSLEYSEAQHNAVFAGPVTIDGLSGQVRGQKTVVYFVPRVKDAPKAATDANVLMGGALDRVVVSGDVRLDQPGRQGTGDELLYKAAEGSFTLTGTAAAAPHIVDAQQGSVTGSSLMFRPGDSTIVVSGAPANSERRPQRARIETRVRQKSE